MNNLVGWFDIYVNDMERAKAFYESVFELELTDLGDPSDSNIVMKTFPCDMEKYGATGALVKMEGIEAGHNSVVVYFSCDDCATAELRIAGNGGCIEKPKFSVGEHGFISLVKDTEGNVIGLHSMK